jgi:hypothetical protein
MRRPFALLVIVLSSATALADPPSPADKAKVVTEATGGKLTALKGKYFEKACGGSLDYEAELVDLNGDGQPEVFTSIQGACLGGAAGVFTNLYIKDKTGQWKPQLGVPGMYTVLPAKHKGFPDIQIGGPGSCAPVWRWNGRAYALHEACA